MSKKYQNAFFIFGLAVLVLMVSQLDFDQVRAGLDKTGYWFAAVVVLWAFLYLFNTTAWLVIINNTGKENSTGKDIGCGGLNGENGGLKAGSDGSSYGHDVVQNVEIDSLNDGSEDLNNGKSIIRNGENSCLNGEKDNVQTSKNSGQDEQKVGFWWLYGITVSGFALNYATPGGLMGGEPYRIMMLSPKIGTERASASVILYVMTHIFSHFWFWLFSCLLYVTIRPVTPFMVVLLLAIASFCLLAIWFFLKGYKKGIAMGCMNVLRRFPMIRKWAIPFIERHRTQLDTIDRQIAALHNQNRRSFVSAVSLEFLCRVTSALEIYFVMLVFMPNASYLDSILILAFTSLFANMLFFMPLQLGGREGGFLMSAKGLALTANIGISVALIVRIRELIWTAIGLMMIKLRK